MQKTLKPLVLLLTTALILACSLSVTQDATPTAVPTETLPPATETSTVPAVETVVPTETSTPVRTTVPVTYNNVSLMIPEGLATGTTNSTSTDVEFPYTNPSNGPMPQHTKIVLTNYRLQNTVLPPEILIFNTTEYAGYAELTGKIVSALQGSKYAEGQPLPAGLPVGALSAQVHPVNFPQGRGVAYLTQFDQTPLPINNRELIYYFHGLTDDGSKYVEVILPVEAKFLPVDENPFASLPADGIPFKLDQLQAYYQGVATRLNETARDDFSPTLTSLDALVESISIQ